MWFNLLHTLKCSYKEWERAMMARVSAIERGGGGEKNGLVKRRMRRRRRVRIVLPRIMFSVMHFQYVALPRLVFFLSVDASELMGNIVS